MEATTVKNDKLDIFDRIMGLPGFRHFQAPDKKHKSVLLYLFFGGLTKAADCFMPHLQETYQRTVFDNYKGTAKFLISELEDGNAALLGAAALAWLDE